MSGEEVLNVRIGNTEKRLCVLEKRLQKLEDELTSVKEGVAETRAYVVQIYDKITRIDEQKTAKDSGALWSKAMIELIRAFVTVGGIIAGIKLIG